MTCLPPGAKATSPPARKATSFSGAIDIMPPAFMLSCISLRTAEVVETPVSVASLEPPCSVKYAADGLDGTDASRTQAWPTEAFFGCWQADKATIAGTSSSADFIPSPSHFGNT